MADAVITYTDEDTGLVFQWHGGAYIDVGYTQAEDVINVWDADRDLSTFEVDAYSEFSRGGRRPFRSILEAFEQRCQEYLTEQQDESEA